MNKTGAEIRGITPEYCMPKCEPELYAQICETDILTIQACDPDIQEIIRIDVDIFIRSFKIIRSPVGKKLLIYAVKSIDVLFKSAGVSYHSRFCIPFCSFIFLDCLDAVKHINVLKEDISFCQVSARSIAVSLFALLVPETHDAADCCHSSGSGAIRCDIKIKNGAREMKDVSPF